MTRFTRATLVRSAAAGGALAATGLLASGFPGRAAQSASGDRTVLSLALAMERLEIAFYETAIDDAKLSGELREYAETALGHEREHLAYITKALGDTSDVPKLALAAKVTDADAFGRLAVALEDGLVAARNGQAGNLTSERLAAVATIVSVEARHAAWIRDVLGELPAPTPSNPSITAAQATAAIHRTGFVKGSA
jgi:hypothetical protein